MALATVKAMGKRSLVAAVVLAIAAVGMPAIASSASAAKCPPKSLGGKTLGWIKVDDVRVPIKKAKYPKGGTLNPPASNKVVGLSARHQGLKSERGTSVFAWHVRYGPGCPGTLNPILDLKPGDTFDVVAKNGDRQAFELQEKDKVKRGKYKAEWFRLAGPRQVTLFTCADPKGGKFRNTEVIIATPVIAG